MLTEMITDLFDYSICVPMRKANIGIALTQTLLLQLREKENNANFPLERFGELKIVQKYTSLKNRKEAE
jgi:hypothetical protein